MPRIQLAAIMLAALWLSGCGAYYSAQGFVTEHTECRHNEAEFDSLRWSPDGSRLVYLLSEPAPDKIAFKSIHIMTVASQGDIVVGNADDGFTGVAWSPDGSRLAFAHGQPGDTILVDYALDSNTGKAARITGGTLHNLDWSPDGEELLFSIDAGSFDYRIKMIPVAAISGAAGEAHTLSLAAMSDISTGEIKGQNGRWSPDGRQIAYSRGLIGAISLIGSDGLGGRELLPRMNGGTQDLSWSPDGAHIVYSVSGAHWEPDVHIVDVASGSDHLAFTGGLSVEWSPDGRQFAYVGDDSTPVPQIYVMDVNGSNIRQLTHKTAQNICLH